MIALVGWLVLAGDIGSRRRRAINQLLAEHRLAEVPPDTIARLERVLPWLAAAAGVRDRIMLNKPFDDQRGVRVFITTGKTSKVTGCVTGNALYDAGLDAIFIDREIVQSSAWEEALATPDEGAGLQISLGLEDVPSLRVYERFVILHELAHREKHRRSGGLFDRDHRGIDPAARAREDEADRFALERIEAAYSIAERFQVVAVEPNTGETINYPIDSTATVSEQVYVSLVEMASLLLTGSIIGGLPRTPYAESYSHASTFVRCLRLVEQALLRPMATEMRAMVEVTRDGLDRMGERARHVTAVSSDDAVVRTFYDAQGVVLCGTRQQIGKADRPLTCRSASFADMDQQPRDALLVARPNGLVLPASDDRTFVPFQNGQLLHLTRDRATPAEGNGVIDFPPTGTVVPLPQPAEWAVLLTYGDEYLAIRNGALISRISRAELRERTGAAIGVPSAGIDFTSPSIDGPMLFTPVAAEGVYIGVATIDLRDFTVQARSLVFREGLEVLTGSNPLLGSDHGAREVVTLPDGRSFVAHLATQRHHSGPARRVRLEVWELFASMPPVLRAQTPLLADRLSHLSPESVEGRFIRPSISGVRWVPPRGIAINVDGDSIFLFDARGSRLNVAFHPGAEIFRMVASTRGHVAVSMPGARQTYVFR